MQSMDSIENLHFFRATSMNNLAAFDIQTGHAMHETTRPATASLTDEVLQRLEACNDPRFKEVMGSLIVHMHDFVRAVCGLGSRWVSAGYDGAVRFGEAPRPVPRTPAAESVIW